MNRREIAFNPKEADILAHLDAQANVSGVKGTFLSLNPDKKWRTQ
ncbi:MAG: hypothetical protein Q4E22_05795 [Coriobacteriia bacterium]|nr:hypothetical protein [Coriobacteriia bacterium]